MKRVAVIGAGISGLACALRLQELKEKNALDIEVSVFEAGFRIGGNIRTEKKDGFLLEKGPDSFISERPVVLDLCRQLGIEAHLQSTNAECRKVSVVRNGRLLSLPEGFYLIAPAHIGPLLKTPLFSAAGKLRMAAEFFVRPGPGGRDESVASFIRRRFGREALERVGQPMIAGIYSGDPEKLSAEAVLPQFLQMERQHGSVMRGLVRRKKTAETAAGPRYGLFLSFRGGMAMLPEAMAARLPAGSIHFGSRVSVQRIPGSGQWAVARRGGPDRTFDAVCLAVNAGQAAEIFKSSDPALSYLLSGIRFESVATLNLAYKSEQFRRPLDSFGLMAPAVENRSFMACTFSSRKFAGRAGQGHVLLRAFIGGAFGKRFFDMEERELVRTVGEDLARLLAIDGPPLFHSLARYPSALPQYDVGHRSLISKTDQLLSGRPGLYLTGSSYRGTGIARAIEDGQAQAERMAGALVTAVTDAKAAVCHS